MTSQSFNWTISHPARVLFYYVLFLGKTNIWNVSNGLFQGRRCERFGSDRWQGLRKGEASGFRRTCVPVLSWDCCISVTFCIIFRNVSEWKFRASLVAQWLRIHLPMQGTRVRALVWEDPTCRGATGPVSHNYWACASGACAPQQERPQ